MFEEGTLERMQGFATGQPFDGLNLPPLRLERREDARVDRDAVDMNGADAALGFLAADLGAGQLQVVAQDVGQCAALRHIERVFGSVDGQVELAHGGVASGLEKRLYLSSRF